MKLFLYGVLALIKNNYSENCSNIENYFSKGIATILYSKHSKIFDSVAFNPDNCQMIDNYYRNFDGIPNGVEHKYACDNNDGLYLIIKLALENMN